MADRSLISHLFRRAAFGARPAELDYYAAKPYSTSVEDLLGPTPLAGGAPSFDETVDPATRVAGNVRGRIAVPALNEIQQTWLGRMVTTSRPLVERMTLFLHDHFATGYRPGDTVDTPELETQNYLFRDNALGNFKTLCHAMLEDVALSCFLSNNVNVPKHPNENLARELFELFTIGIGTYTETDVRESARALTGYRFAYNLQGTDPLKEATGPRYVMLFDPTQHDAGVKTVLGVKGALMPHDIIDIALSQPVAPSFIARKLIEWFVAPNPATVFVDRIAGTLLSNNWELKPTLRAIFNSAEFMDPGLGARSAVVKSPAEFVVGGLRALNRTSSDDYTIALGWMSDQGQRLYDPPNVGGWPSNMGWLGAGGVLARYNAGVVLADRHVSDTVLPGQTPIRSTTPQGWGQIFGITDLAPSTVDAMNGYLHDPATATATTQTVDAAMIALLLASPDYNLA